MTKLQVENIGTCQLCNKEVAYRTMTRHLQQCIKTSFPEKSRDTVKPSKQEIFLIKLLSEKFYWLYVEINGKSALEDLDDLLRGVWLECCGHLSQFKINGDYYDSHDNMDEAIQNVFPLKSKFDYYYDFGSTTHIQGEVISSRPGALKKGMLHILARNNMPDNMVCKTCQVPAEMICTVCYDLCCEKCVKKHEKKCEGEEYMLPVVNSPRMGVCGYEG
jgi:hypothetical protein